MFCINSLEMGGAERLLVNIIDLLYETKKYEIFLLTRYKSNSYFFNQIKDKVVYEFLADKDKEKLYKKFGIFGRFINSIKKQKKFKSMSKKVHILIDFLDADFYKYIRKQKNIKKVTWLHSNYKYLVLRKKIQKKLKYYDDIVVITEAMYNELLEKKYNNNLHLLYNVVDFKMLDYLLLNDEKNINNEKFFLTVCRLEEQSKDVVTLLEAFSKYFGIEKLYIIGNGPNKQDLIRVVKRLKIEERVRFLGTIENPFPYMKACEAFILSTKSEGFGLVLVEALYCGAKVISSNCEYGPKEILLNGEIGELFEVGNSEELLNKLKSIKEKEYSREKIKKSLERFDKEIFFKELERKVLCQKKI